MRRSPLNVVEADLYRLERLNPSLLVVNSRRQGVPMIRAGRWSARRDTRSSENISESPSSSGIVSRSRLRVCWVRGGLVWREITSPSLRDLLIRPVRLGSQEVIVQDFTTDDCLLNLHCLR